METPFTLWVSTSFQHGSGDHDLTFRQGSTVPQAPSDRSQQR